MEIGGGRHKDSLENWVQQRENFTRKGDAKLVTQVGLLVCQKMYRTGCLFKLVDSLRFILFSMYSVRPNDEVG